LESGALSSGHANALGAVKDEKKQIELANQIVREGLSVREAETLAAAAAGKAKPKTSRTAARSRKSEEIRAIEDELTSIMGTRVTLGFDGRGGSIQIRFYSKDELDGLIDEIRALRD
jgi:ParB family chromosome partitioning protein